MDALYAVASIVLIMVGLVIRPPHATCPPRWWIPEGMRTNGEFVCRPPLTGTDERTARGILVDHSTQPPGGIELHVYCPPNSIPTLIGPGTGLCAP